MRRRAGLILKIALLLVAVLVAAGSVYGVITVRSSFPQTTGSVTVPGLTAPVQVARDAWGVPQITAHTAEDR